MDRLNLISIVMASSLSISTGLGAGMGRSSAQDMGYKATTQYEVNGALCESMANSSKGMKELMGLQSQECR